MTSEPTPGAPVTERLPFPLQQQEQVIRICRRHWIHLWPKTIYLAPVGAVPLVLISLLLAGGTGTRAPPRRCSGSSPPCGSSTGACACC
jgi:hypothetical protein